MIKHKAFASTRVLALMLGATLITSGKAKADFVIPDDLIVQGSACVGLEKSATPVARIQKMTDPNSGIKVMTKAITAISAGKGSPISR